MTDPEDSLDKVERAMAAEEAFESTELSQNWRRLLVNLMPWVLIAAVTIGFLEWARS